MSLPKLTRTRFILLWGASVVMFFLISWKFIFKTDEIVAGMSLIHVAEVDQDGGVIHLQENDDHPLIPNLDIMHDDNVPRRQSLKGLDAAQSITELDSKEADHQSNENAFLSVPHDDLNRQIFNGFGLWKMQKPVAAAQTKKDMSRTKPLFWDESAEEEGKDDVASETNEPVKNRFSDEENALNRDDVGMFNHEHNTPFLLERNQFKIPSKVSFLKDQSEYYKKSHDINQKGNTLFRTPKEETQFMPNKEKNVQPRMFHQTSEHDGQQQLNLQAVRPTLSSLKMQMALGERNSPFHEEMQHVKRHDVVANFKTEGSLVTDGNQHGSQYKEAEPQEEENIRFVNSEAASTAVTTLKPRIRNDDSKKLDNTVLVKDSAKAFHLDKTSDPPNVILNQPTRRESEVQTGNAVSTRKSYDVDNVSHQTEKQTPVEVTPITKHASLRGDTADRKVRPEHETDQEFLQRMEERQEERHARIRQQCQSRYGLSLLDFQRDHQKILSWKKYFEHAYANDDHQFIICRVLKVGSFSWRKVMISLYKKGSQEFRRSQKQGDFPMMDYNDAKFMSKLENYKRILFVRDPFVRFLSAYRDKYIELRHFPYYQPIGRNIIRKYRRNPSNAEVMSGRPTFEEFTRWVIAEEVPEGDFHWRPLFNVYHPCEINYDYIGKLETSAEDARYVFKMIGIDGIETFPSTETHHKFSSNAEVLEEFYSQLSPELLPKLIDRYREEFELFDYPIPQALSDIWTKAES